MTMPVYYAVEAGSGSRLAREFREVPDRGGPVVAAARAMIDTPTVPDYRSLWNPKSEIRSVDVTRDVIEVDLVDRDVFAAEADPDLAIQQLVYTVTAAADMAGQAAGPRPVRVLVDGSPTETIGEGRQTVDVSELLERVDETVVRLLVQIDDPAEGATVGRSVHVTGAAATFEGTVLWEVRRDGHMVKSGFATAEECCIFSPFSFTVELSIGDYQVIVMEDDQSAGEGLPAMVDRRTFTVE